MSPAKQHTDRMASLMQSVGYHSPREVFQDFCEMAAIAFSNAFEVTHREVREAQYMRLISKYKPAHHDMFRTLLEELTLAMEKAPGDILGQMFMEIGGASPRAGQFFTPESVTRVLHDLTLADPADIRRIIEERGFITVSEPACGAGAVAIGFALKLQEMGVNYQQHMHATLVDIDIRAVHMAFVQLSLLHVPAVVVHGDSLTLKEHSRWYTLAHAMGLFDIKMRRGFSLDSAKGREWTKIAPDFCAAG
ncbi:N-6 DNA methylase [Pseudomonas guariconensis]|uniref:N-6 DNA methylase n=1 Tax=Pseudomonas guariconensis TaxID=1288410 RepID=UPI0039061519